MDTQNSKEKALEILKNKTALVFSGGGVMGIGQVGSLNRAVEKGLSLSNIKSVTGSSVGSIISTAIAAGANIEYINQKMHSIDLQKMRNHKCILGEVVNFVKRYGLHKTEGIESFIASVLKDLTGNPNITFKELYDLTEIHLTITYLSLNFKRTIYADYINEPDSLIKDAVVKSSTIPLFYEAHFEGNKNSLQLAADGGINNNFAMNVPHLQVSPGKILGFKFITTEDIDHRKVVDFGPPKHVIEYLTTIIEILREQAMRIHVKENDWMLTVKIDVGDLSSTSFDITEEQQLWLYQQGENSVNNYLQELEWMIDNDKYPYL